MDRFKTQRIWCDENQIYHVQERYVPVLKGEGDGWKDIFVTDNMKEAIDFRYGVRSI